MNYLAIIGQILCLVAAFGIAGSFILIKKGISAAEQSGTKSYKHLGWWLGVICLKIFTSFYVVALALADQATLSTFCAMTLVFNSILAWKFLGE